MVILGGFGQIPPKTPILGGTRKMAKMADFPGTSSHSELFFLGQKRENLSLIRGGRAQNGHFGPPRDPQNGHFGGPPGRGGKPPKWPFWGFPPLPPILGGFGQNPPKTPFCHMAAPRVNPPARPDLISAPTAVL